MVMPVNSGAARILVVDDEPTVREVVVQYLHRDGYIVHELDRGDLVADALTTFRPDLIVLDIMLPGLPVSTSCVDRPQQDPGHHADCPSRGGGPLSVSNWVPTTT
jgi:CheY-like chemotaxis protein